MTYNDYWVDNYLAHYGVLGMRWGTRKIRSAVTGKRKIGWDEDVVIKKGSSTYRVSTKRKDEGNNRYLTVDQNDRNFYAGMWPTTLKSVSGTVGKSSQLYENKYKTTEELRSPSAKKREEIATSMAKSKKITKEIVKQHLVLYLVKTQGYTLKDAEKAVIRAEKNKSPSYMTAYANLHDMYSSQYLKSKSAASIVLGTTGTSKIIRDEYLRRVKKAGYNAVIDDHGADFESKSQRVNAPIISLTAEKSLKPIRSIKLTDFRSDASYDYHKRSVESLKKKQIDNLYVPNVIKNTRGLNNYE